LHAQEKVPKEKGTRRPHRLAPIPCVPRPSGDAHNSEADGFSICLASNRVRVFIPNGLRYAVGAQRDRGWVFNPGGAAEQYGN